MRQVVRDNAEKKRRKLPVGKNVVIIATAAAAAGKVNNKNNAAARSPNLKSAVSPDRPPREGGTNASSSDMGRRVASAPHHRMAAFFAGENRLMAVIVIDVRACGANNATIRVLPAYQHVC